MLQSNHHSSQHSHRTRMDFSLMKVDQCLSNNQGHSQLVNLPQDQGSRSVSRRSQKRPVSIPYSALSMFGPVCNRMECGPVGVVLGHVVSYVFSKPFGTTVSKYPARIETCLLHFVWRRPVSIARLGGTARPVGNISDDGSCPLSPCGPRRGSGPVREWVAIGHDSQFFKATERLLTQRCTRQRPTLLWSRGRRQSR